MKLVTGEGLEERERNEIEICGQETNENVTKKSHKMKTPDKGDRFPYCYTTVSQATSPVSVFPFGSGW